MGSRQFFLSLFTIAVFFTIWMPQHAVKGVNLPFKWLEFPRTNDTLVPVDNNGTSTLDAEGSLLENSTNNTDATITTNHTINWDYCPHTSQNSYINFTFTPYPIRRGHPLNITLRGHIEEQIEEGTTLEMKSSHMLIPFIVGPRAKIDICQYIAEQYKDAPHIRCPMTKWAVMLILLGIQQNGGQLGQNNIRVPLFVIPGPYKAVVKLKTKYEDLTCAQTVLQVK